MFVSRLKVCSSVRYSKLQVQCSILRLLSVVQVDAIPPGNHYFGPAFAEADICSCNVVIYSLVSACGGCQGRNFINWANWTLNCVAINKQTYASKNMSM
ncbi:hypothetical protein FPV67DRAFT_14510 [Lyophyllum atratum]|nr:hypothetical protein FPV67DRAFT_14510 [Lyophyllum atratum]